MDGQEKISSEAVVGLNLFHFLFLSLWPSHSAGILTVSGRQSWFIPFACRMLLHQQADLFSL
jgi:hypothetical protein